MLITKDFGINPDCVGQSPQKIATMAGFTIPADAPIIAVEISGIGKDHPLSAEKLSPVLSLYFVDNFAAALDACEAVLRFGGLGHTCGICANDDARIREYALRMPAYRVVANTPTPKGSTGITTNVFPAMTLGCGAIAGNSTSDNISPLHLINIKRLAYDRGEMSQSVSRSEIVKAVERYLAQRGVSPTPKETPVPSKPVETPAPPPVQAVDFVCDDDVRRAITESRKIFISPKAIVTPSARDLANTHDILIPVKG